MCNFTARIVKQRGPHGFGGFNVTGEHLHETVRIFYNELQSGRNAEIGHVAIFELDSAVFCRVEFHICEFFRIFHGRFMSSRIFRVG